MARTHTRWWAAPSTRECSRTKFQQETAVGTPEKLHPGSYPGICGHINISSALECAGGAENPNSKEISIFQLSQMRSSAVSHTEQTPKVPLPTTHSDQDLRTFEQPKERNWISDSVTWWGWAVEFSYFFKGRNKLFRMGVSIKQDWKMSW